MIENLLPPVNKNIETPKSEQEQAALKKLEKLLSPDLPGFAVRFMNIGEYNKILRKGYTSGQAYKIESYTGKPVKFEDYLKAGKGQWSSIAWEQTDWRWSILNLNDYELLMELLRDSHAEAKTRDEFLRRFPLKVLAIAKQKDDSISINSEEIEDVRNFQFLPN